MGDRITSGTRGRATEGRNQIRCPARVAARHAPCHAERATRKPIGKRETQGADAVLSVVHDHPVRFATRLAVTHVRGAGEAIRHTRKALRAGVAWWRADTMNRIVSQKSVFVRPPRGFIVPDARDETVVVPGRPEERHTGVPGPVSRDFKEDRLQRRPRVHQAPGSEAKRLFASVSGVGRQIEDQTESRLEELLGGAHDPHFPGKHAPRQPSEGARRGGRHHPD